MIILVTGPFGSGKTTWVTSHLLQHYKQGREIWTNMPLKLLPYLKIESDGSTKTSESNAPVVIALDESYVIFDSRSSASRKRSKRLLTLVQEHGHILYAIAPETNMIQKCLRDAAVLHIELRSIAGIISAEIEDVKVSNVSKHI